nr:MAG TPA: hypothetical protein [Caudoviricetes sp.]
MTLEEYWAEIVADIGNIETHGDAISAISEKIKTEDTDIGALMSERDALVAERDELRGKYDNAVAEIKSRWSDLSHGGSITKVTEFGKPDGTEEVATSVDDLDWSQLTMSGKGE